MESEFDSFIKLNIKNGVIVVLLILISSESFVFKEHIVDAGDKFPIQINYLINIIFIYFLF